eukprot:TRINITY_DN1560_c0_g1_i1.p1 TRINITY_DN1560_c0_g1~~TRINITY_DN1560_c0_g1_i1.p1  ORF type:complete len:228 (-),score=57.93 TRINITY_DN1560_c0_g1_i1:769-1452(-)
MIHLRFVLSGSDLPQPNGPHERLVVVGNHAALGLGDPLSAPDLLPPSEAAKGDEIHQHDGDDESLALSPNTWSLQLTIRIGEDEPTLPFTLVYNFVLVSESALVYHGDDKEIVIGKDHLDQTLTIMDVWDREKQHKFFPVLDERTISEIEQQAAQVSASLGVFMNTLQSSLQEVTSVTLQNVVAFERSITHMSDTVQSTVRISEDFVKKCIQLDEDLKYMDSLSLQM